MYEVIAKKFPGLKNELIQAGMNVKPEDFIKKTILLTILITFTLFACFLLIFLKLELGLGLLFLIIPLSFFVFILLLKSPRTKIKGKINDVDREIVYAGRFLLIELSAGVPLFNAMVNVSKNFKYIGKSFKEIVDRVEVGKPIDQALNEVMEITPSDNFRKLIWQVMSALQTGGDVSVAVAHIVDQISKEQMIDLKQYNKKLNPLVMFYLMIAVIIPSLGIAMLSLLSTFLGFTLGVGSLISIAIFIGIIQLFFLTMVKSSRPGISI
ncbi:MAG: type II secretion system F family protein [Nanoarchaeota archaeon]|nr:type II secretion system F family protein [Nanoarchaeota archaeon]